MQKNKIMFVALVVILSYTMIAPVGASSFSATVDDSTIPGGSMDIEVSTDPEGVGAILIWKPIYDDGVLIDDWCDFLEILSEDPLLLIACADILIFDSDYIEASYPDTWEDLLENEMILDPFEFDPCGFDPEELPMVVWNDDLEGWQTEVYGPDYCGPNTNTLGKYFVVIFAVDAAWVESLIEAICNENGNDLYELVCDPTWIGAFITTFFVIPEFPTAIAGIATPLLAFATLRVFKRKKLH